MLYSNGVLYGTDSTAENTANYNTVFSMATAGAAPTAASSTMVTTKLGPTSATRSPWNFIFENTTSLYITDDSNTTSFNVLHWTSVGTSWSQINTISFDKANAVYSIAGRYLYNNAVGKMPYSSFVLYAATKFVVYSYVPATGTISTFYTPASGTLVRGVVSAPYAASPTSTPSTTASPTSSSTATRTSTATQTASLSFGASSSQTPTATNTQTPTQTPTPTTTSTQTQTPTQTPVSRCAAAPRYTRT